MMSTPMGMVHHAARFQLAAVNVSGYGIAMVLAFLIARVVIAAENRRQGEDATIASEIVLSAAVGGLFGSRLSYAALTGGPLLVRSDYTFWGGLAGGAAAFWIWACIRRVSFFRYLDATGMAIAAGYAVGRTGCWAVGDDYGRPWYSRFAVRFPEGSPPSSAATMIRLFGERLPSGVTPSDIVPVYPTQLYETVLGLAMFALLWRLRNHSQAPGWLFGLYCVIAGVERFLIEFVRATPVRLGIGLSGAQAISIAVIALGMLLMRARRRDRAASRLQAADVPTD